jgi:hypothetical protein
MNRFSLDREGNRKSAVARTLVATAFVAGFAALVWVHVDFEQDAVPALAAPAHLSACTTDDCLHAPAGDPSVPAASSVFPNSGTSPIDVPSTF